MKIVMFSINPLFPNKVTGGASKHLYHIARHLGAQGHHVTILCAQSDGTPKQFYWDDRVKVLPTLPFNLPFPQPYAISGADLALITDKLLGSLSDADRFYIHDGEWLIPDVYQTVPTIISFRDNIYPESVLGTFVGKADDIICVSEYSKNVIENTAGRFFPDLNRRLHLVNNGIDLNVFFPKNSSVIEGELNLNPKNAKILLHPHRPEPGKGLPETIQVVHQLVHLHGITNLKVLVPEWIGEMVSPGEAAFLHEMKQLMADLDVEGYFQFIPWMPIERMPELYSLADVTLCLGNIVEAFGNVAYESLACGTPSIVARVGVHRRLLPDALIDKVHFGDIEGAVQRILAYFRGKKLPWNDIAAYLDSVMNFEKQVNNYSEIILNCKKRSALKFSPIEIKDDQPFVLAPWCYCDGARIYHDFRGRFEDASGLTDFIRRTEIISLENAILADIGRDEWADWITKTYLVPLCNQ